MGHARIDSGNAEPTDFDSDWLSPLLSGILLPRRSSGSSEQTVPLFRI